MKKPIFFLLITTYTVLLGFEETCLLNLVGITFGVSLDGGSVLAEYPRFTPFCIIAGFFALICIVVLLFLNVRWSEKLGYTKKMWAFQWAVVAVLSLPIIKLWETVFGHLQNIF